MTKYATVDDYVSAQPQALRAIAEKLLPVIEAVLPGSGAVWHGHPVWSLGAAPGTNPVCLIKAYPSHLTFGVWRGREIADDSGRLDTSGGMAHVKLRALGDVDAALFTGWLNQACALEKL
jgi:hypothetical protein